MDMTGTERSTRETNKKGEENEREKTRPKRCREVLTHKSLCKPGPKKGNEESWRWRYRVLQKKKAGGGQRDTTGVGRP